MGARALLRAHLTDRPSIRRAAPWLAVLGLAAWNNRFAWAHLLNPASWDAAAPWRFAAVSLAPLAAAAVLLWLCWGLGLLVLRRPGAGAEALGLGVGAAACAALLTGLAGAWPAGLWASGALALAGARPAWRASRGWRPPSAAPPWAAAALAWCAWHVLWNAWAPAVGWDATAYHLALPKIYLASGGVRDIDWLLHGRWPHLMEVLYALPLSLGLEPAAALIHAALSAGTVALTLRLGREELGDGAGWAAAALLAAQPVFLEVASEPHCDGAMALLHLSACAGLWRWGKSGVPRDLILAGLFSGLAAACKLQGVVLGAALALWVLRRGGPRSAALYALAAALPVAPWLARTWLATGNPVWPFAWRWLGGAGEPERVAAALERVLSWRRPVDADLLLRYGPQWMLLPLAAAGLLARRRLAPLAEFLLWPAAALALAVWPYQEAWRFLVPALPALALAAAGWASRAGPWGRLAVASGLWPILGLAQGNELFAVSGARSGVLPGRAAREAYRARQLPISEFYEEVPPEARVLLFREVRGYHLKADYRWGDPVLQRAVPYDRLETAPELAARLRELGLTHVLVNGGNALYGPDERYYSRRILALMEETLRRCAEPVRARGPFTLHRLSPACAPPR